MSEIHNRAKDLATAMDYIQRQDEAKASYEQAIDEAKARLARLRDEEDKIRASKKEIEDAVISLRAEAATIIQNARHQADGMIEAANTRIKYALVDYENTRANILKKQAEAVEIFNAHMDQKKQSILELDDVIAKKKQQVKAVEASYEKHRQFVLNGKL